MAEDFVLDGRTLVTDVHLWFRTFLDANWDGSLPWYFLADDGGLPGGVLASGVATVPPAVSTSLGNGYLEYSFDLPAPLLLDGGTTYWLALGFPSTLTYFWSSTGIDFGNPSATGFIGGDWVQREPDMAFQLTGTPVPEPATLLLLGTGLGAAAARRRKRRA